MGQARGGLITASLTADPSTIPAGGSTNVTFTLSYTPIGYDLNYESLANGGYEYYGYVGDGYITNVGANLYSGDGQTTIPINSTSSTNSVTYASAGSYTASVSGTVGTADYYEVYGGPLRLSTATTITTITATTIPSMRLSDITIILSTIRIGLAIL